MNGDLQLFQFGEIDEGAVLDLSDAVLVQITANKKIIQLNNS